MAATSSSRIFLLSSAVKTHQPSCNLSESLVSFPSNSSSFFLSAARTRSSEAFRLRSEIHAARTFSDSSVRRVPASVPKASGSQAIVEENKENKNMEKGLLLQLCRRIPPKLMIVSDLDNTMVDHKDPNHESLLRFNSLWTSQYADDSLLVFSTGRSPTAFKQLKAQVPLLTPGILILSVGTEILYGDAMVPDDGWETFLDEGWNRSQVVEEASKFSGLRWQTESEQRPHKVSFNVDKSEAPEIIEKLSSRLRERGLKVKIIYSGGYDLDLLPERAGKGEALSYLLRSLKEEGALPLNTLACGDSGNDQELFTVDGAKGVIVGNAMDELVQWYEKQRDTEHLFRATERCAAGIMQAMAHFQI